MSSQGDVSASKRFKREYEISALLPHEHIVQVLDFQYDQVLQTWALAMEFLEGEELRYILKRESVLPPERLVRMLSHVAIGLDEAHARGFIHRDLKPDNLFLCGTREGDVVKILDFGSVKDTGGSRKKLTVLGTTIGSPYYMAPEQAQGLDSLQSARPTRCSLSGARVRVHHRRSAVHGHQRSVDPARDPDEGPGAAECQDVAREVFTSLRRSTTFSSRAWRRTRTSVFRPSAHWPTPWGMRTG